MKHHRIFVKRICHFVSQIILYLGTLLKSIKCFFNIKIIKKNWSIWARLILFLLLKAGIQAFVAVKNTKIQQKLTVLWVFKVPFEKGHVWALMALEKYLTVFWGVQIYVFENYIKNVKTEKTLMKKVGHKEDICGYKILHFWRVFDLVPLSTDAPWLVFDCWLSGTKAQMITFLATKVDE
jgi:hypothetical protein